MSSFQTIYFSFSFSDYDYYWGPQDRPSPSPPPRLAENRTICGVRSCRLALVDGVIHVDRPLAGLYLLRHREHGAASPQGQSGLVGQSGANSERTLFAERHH